MSKRLIVILALALLVGLTFSSAYAEVQNVKVSGDIVASGVARSHFNLNSTDTAGDASALKQNFLMTQARVRVDADLTDNVSTTVRLINERIWNGQNDTGVSNNNNTNIDLDLAYVALKEFLYSPLTLTIGRQEISFGNSLVIGKSGAASGTTSIPSDLSKRAAFDAIRATLNYDPLVLDLVYAQVKQSTTVDRNTTSLTGVNANYALNKKVNLSAYYWLKKDKNLTAATASRADKVNTIGGLISATPIENLSASVEAAYQFGKNAATGNQKKHDAYALQAMADYTLSKVKMTPKIGASWTYLSGGETSATRNDGWDTMFYNQQLNNIVYALLPFTNMSAINIKASCKPVEDVTLSAVYGYYNVAEKHPGSTFTSPSRFDGTSTYLTTQSYSGKKHLGDALDITATYDYTEDVQFALTGGTFAGGNALLNNEKTATQVIGSMKVTF